MIVSSQDPSRYSPELQLHLAGRSLLASEIPLGQTLIDRHFQDGFVKAEPGIKFVKKKPVCSRCCCPEPRLYARFPCSRCGKECWYCRHCVMMGRVSECELLYSWSGPEPEHPVPNQVLAWTGALSSGQQEASDRTLDTMLSGGSLLVWAVCGAGKTEVLFHGMAAAIERGLRVCIATPRTDVVLELAPRLRKAFPHVSTAALYGGSEERDVPAILIAATAHQLYRFATAFDVIVVDEVDAFPYSFDLSLQLAVQKAGKPRSSLIYLTATPSSSMQKLAASGKQPSVKIPARFHRRPIPVPEMAWCGNWQKPIAKKSLPERLYRWTAERLAAGTPFLIFFPVIEWMEQALPIFQELDARIRSVHSADPLRKEKVQSLRRGEAPGLLTTTILERGVTIPRLDAAVLGAEHIVFTESALVQIAGRVGRSSEHSTGNVTFFHHGRTNAMVRAVKQITSMNAEARKRGLIDVP